MSDTMAYVTQVNSTEMIEGLHEDPNKAVKYIWIFGLVLSLLCLILQLVLFKIRPRLRKMEQKIITQLTVARLINSGLDYMVTYKLFNLCTRDFFLALYLQSDIVLVCWMSMYTKNLHDKVVQVLYDIVALPKWNFVGLSLVIWLFTTPLGVLCPILLKSNKFDDFYKVYSGAKFGVLTLNVLVFCEIFFIIKTRSNNSKRNLTQIIKTSVISFILLCLLYLQVFICDILSYLEMIAVTNAFCVINSFKGIAATFIFLILAKNSMPDGNIMGTEPIP